MKLVRPAGVAAGLLWAAAAFGGGGLVEVERTLVRESEEPLNFCFGHRFPDGTIYLSHSMGVHMRTERGVALFSPDDGRTWTEKGGHTGMNAFLTKAGEKRWIGGWRPVATNVHDITVTTISVDGKETVVTTPIAFPEPMQLRLHRGTLRLADGRLLQTAYTPKPPKARCYAYVIVSDDEGLTWRFHAWLPEMPSASEGLNEASAVQRKDGTILLFVRSGQVLEKKGDISLMRCESTDGGKTWGPLKKVADYGVDPQAGYLSDGTLFVLSGRPGVYLLLDPTGTGDHFVRHDLYRGMGSSYSTLVEPAPGKLKVFYDESAFVNLKGDTPTNRIWQVSYERRPADGPAALVPFRPGEVAVRGEIGRRMDRTLAHIMDDIDVDREFIRHFRERKEKPDTYDGFTGWSMMLDAIVKAAAHGVGGERGRAFKEKCVAATIATQTPDGNLSIFAGSLGTWDSHEQAYLLQAFCRDAEWFGNREALAAARRLGDYMLAQDAKLLAGVDPAFVLLYRLTGDVRYIDWVRDRHLIERDDAAFVSVTPVNGIDHVYSNLERAFAQLDYAAVTGRRSPTFEDSAKAVYRRLAGDFLSVTGTAGGLPSLGEFWDDSQIGQHPWGETCVTAYLLRLTAQWMTSHPDSACGDLYERVMYNALFGAQTADGKKLRYFSPFNQVGEWWPREGYCCPNNFRRIVFELPDAVFFRTPGGFAVNLFAPATLRVDGLTVDMETAYPDEGSVALRIRSDRPGEMHVRVPRWTGLPDAGSWRSYAYRAGETAVSFAFPMALRFVRGRQAQKGRFALMRGPIVFAAERHGSYVDCWNFDVSRPMTFRNGCVEATMLDGHHRRPRHETKLVPFSSEDRKRVFFPIVGTGGPKIVDDELFGCEAFLGKR